MKLSLENEDLFNTISLEGREKEIFLKILDILKGKTLRFKEIYSHLSDYPKSAVASVLKKMEKAGMVERIQKSKKLVYYELSDNFIKTLQRWIKEWEMILKK